MRHYTQKELNAMPNQDVGHLSMYIEIPKDYVLKLGLPWEDHLLYNPITNHAMIYYYYETECYVESASDIQYNGHYETSQNYTPQ